MAVLRLLLMPSKPALAVLPSPRAMARFFRFFCSGAVVVAPAVVARALVPVARAVHPMQLVASAVLPAPVAMARECSPEVVNACVVSAGSVSRTVLPLTDIVIGSEDGLADATHGTTAAATTPAPMPNATASAP